MSRTVLDELVIQLGLHTASLQTNAQRALHLLAALDTQSRSDVKNREKVSQKKGDSVSALQRHAVGLLGFACGGRGLATLAQTFQDNKKSVPVKIMMPGLGNQKAQKQENPFVPVAQPSKRLDPLTARVFQQNLSLVRQPFLSDLHQNTVLTPVKSPLARERFARPLALRAENHSQLMQTQAHQTPQPLRFNMAVARVVPESQYQLGKAQGITPTMQLLSSTPMLPTTPQLRQAPNLILRTEEKQKEPVFENNTKREYLLPTVQVERAEATGGVTPQTVQQQSSHHVVEEKKQRTFRQFPALNAPKTFRATRRLPPEGASEHIMAFGAPSVPQHTLPVAMLAQLATAAAPHPSVLSTPAANTTYIGPVTISVPSGNPQAIAEALQNMAHENNHVLASLATRGAV